MRMKSWQRGKPQGFRPATVQPKPSAPQAERRSIMTSAPKPRPGMPQHVENASGPGGLLPDIHNPSHAAVSPKLLSPSAHRRRKTHPLESDSPMAAAVSSSNELLSMLNASKTLRSHDDSSSAPASTQLVLDVVCRRFRVGSATSNYPCHVEFFRDRAQYSFQHHKHQKIGMCMYYEDMVDVTVNSRSRALEFRIPRPLEFFSQDYDFTKPEHLLAIHFEMADDCANVQTKVLPLMASVHHASKHHG
eukprot:jgi/Mesvir1/9782/Mv09250-RA.1